MKPTKQVQQSWIKSKENEAYEVADIEIFTKPNEAYYVPGCMCSYRWLRVMRMKHVELSSLVWNFKQVFLFVEKQWRFRK